MILRFAVRLPKLLMTAVLPPEIMDRYLGKFGDFMKFLAKHQEQYFEMAAYLPFDEAMAMIEANEGMQALQAGNKITLHFYQPNEDSDDLVNGKRKRTKSSKLVESA